MPPSGLWAGQRAPQAKRRPSAGRPEAQGRPGSLNPAPKHRVAGGQGSGITSKSAEDTADGGAVRLDVGYAQAPVIGRWAPQGLRQGGLVAPLARLLGLRRRSARTLSRPLDPPTAAFWVLRCASSMATTHRSTRSRFSALSSSRLEDLQWIVLRISRAMRRVAELGRQISLSASSHSGPLPVGG